MAGDGYRWTPDLSVGIVEIDEQHRELIRSLERLRAHMTDGMGREEISETYVFLMDYIDKHFALEEDFMEATAYPKMTLHVKAHDTFRNKMAEFRARYNVEGPSSAFVILVAATTFKWFREHILVTDMELGKHLAKQMTRKVGYRTPGSG